MADARDDRPIEPTAPVPGDDEVPEPATATHGAEDETWSTPGDDAPHLHAKVEELTARVAELEQELGGARERMLRARADYDNLVRRTEQERSALGLAASGRVIERLLEPLEVLQRAAAESEGIEDAHAQGMRLAYRGLRGALEREGLEEVAGVGAKFDPNLHEAVAKQADASEPGTVIEVVRPGYRVHGRLLRAALVKVSAGPA